MVEAQRVLLTKRLQDFAMKDLQDGFHLETHAGRFPISKGELIAKIADKEGILCMPYDTIGQGGDRGSGRPPGDQHVQRGI